MSENQEITPNQPRDEITRSERWSHLDEFEQKYFKQRIKAYDEIMEVNDDVPKIANRYQLSAEEVQRAKNYAFGSGVSENKFIPDPDMAAAWKRIASEQGTDIDEVLLKHEIFESYLVLNQGMNQKDAHELAQERYPWSNLLKEESKNQ